MQNHIVSSDIHNGCKETKKMYPKLSFYSVMRIRTLARLNRKYWRSVRKCLVGVCVVLVLFINTQGLSVFLSPSDITLPVNANCKTVEPFEPEVYMDLNFNTNGRAKIERNIHQTWKDEHIPSNFVENVKSFVQKNPSWKYYFWTDESARQLIVDHYPFLLPVWDGVWYSSYPIRRADALRYLVLYHYGGIYADLDMINYRSLDTAITKHSCVFTPEPYEHAVTRAFRPYLLSNAVMLCASKHPFLERLIENLFSTEFFTNSVDSTGPGYLTTQFYVHNMLPHAEQHLEVYHGRSMDPLVDNSPYLDKGGVYPLTHKKSVYVANTRYFIYSLDESIHGRLIRECARWTELDHLHKRSCRNVQILGLRRKRHMFAYTEHQWYMTWINWKGSMFPLHDYFIRLFSVHIAEIAPDYIMYESDYLHPG